MKTITCPSLDALEETAKKLIQYCGEDRIWVFQGSLGAGKTTLIKAIAGEFGVKDGVSSPTFSLVNEYQNRKGEVFYHFDFYRVEDPEEVFEIGVEEYFYSGHRCWIEWAEKIPGYIPNDFVHILIEIEQDGTRMITLTKVVNGNADG